MELQALLDDVDGNVKTELSCKPEIIDKGDDLDVDELPIVARKWHRVKDAIAVVADLRGSTQLGMNKHKASTASIYEAATGGVVKILGSFDADFIAIQGDGAFGLFWGDKRSNRAFCAGVTIKTFSEKSLVPRLTDKWAELPETGFKVGIGSSSLLVKRVGIPRSSHQEPVWAGRAVNYAAKAAQQADRHQMIVTGAIWDWAQKYDYIAASCPCGDGPRATLWEDVTIEKIPADHAEREGKLLKSTWCEKHGSEYCAAILAGKKKRDDVGNQVTEAIRAEMRNAIREKAASERRDRLSRLDGFK